MLFVVGLVVLQSLLGKGQLFFQFFDQCQLVHRGILLHYGIPYGEICQLEHHGLLFEFGEGCQVL